MNSVLAEGLPALEITSSVIPDLVRFAQLVLDQNKVMNLTAITDPAQFAALHLLDSLQLVPAAGLNVQSVADVGCGAGFPGVPLAIACPDLQVTLLDSTKKRIDFLQNACRSLNLSNARCVHARAEEFAAQHRESFDFAVSRAVANLPVLCELCLPLVKTGGAMLAMKSCRSDEEIASAHNAILSLGGRLDWVKDYSLPAAGAAHRIVCIRKISPCPTKFPRRFAAIKKSPL